MRGLPGQDAAVDLSLSFEGNHTSHRDIVLRFAGQQWVCDSYYLAIDQNFLGGIEDDRKVRAVLRRLHEQWLEALQHLDGGDVAYLPYDLSDQYSAWLRCTRTPTGYSIVRGWSPVEGHSFSPSAVGALLHSLEGFRVDGPALEVAAADLLKAIQSSAARTA